MMNIKMCFDGDGQFVQAGIDELPEILERERSFVWIDVDAGSPDGLAALQQQFGLHRLAVENALAGHQRANITLYDDMIYLEFYGLQMKGDEVQSDDMGIFAGEKFLITVRRNDMPSLAGITARWKDEQDSGIPAGEAGTRSSVLTNGRAKRKQPSTSMLLYAILDDMVDSYFPVVDWVGDQVEDLEAMVVEGETAEPQLAIQTMRSNLLHVRRLISPEQEVLNTLLRRDVPIIEEAIIPYFADVHDHLLRIHDWMESYRDQLSTIVDLQLSMQSNRLDRTMRTLTAWSIILMGCGLIAGIYGMNFHHMPELTWRYGYFLALGLMVVVGGGLYAGFRKMGWW